MAASNANYSHLKSGNYNKYKASDSNKLGDNNSGREKSNYYSKLRDINSRDKDNKFKSKENNSWTKDSSSRSNSNFRNQKKEYNYKNNQRPNYDGDRQASYSNSEPENEIDNDVFLEKLETKKRLEREKEIKRRKHKEKDASIKEKKHQAIPKKLKNVDWTKDYEDGLFDDEFYDEYMR